MSEPIIYLHGFASGPGSKKARFFREHFSALGFELVIPDLTEGNFEGLTITGQLKVVERLASGEPVSLIGSSMGGYLAALYAARHPDTRKIVLMAPAFCFARRWPAEEWKRAGFLPVYNYANQQPARVGYQLYEDAQHYEDYPQVTQPTLIFHGQKDDAVPATYSEEFAAGRPNVRLEILDSDHELLNVTEHMWTATQAFLIGS
jgi:pimeloyl-ACP methyl ester carboxylesterase